MSHAQPTAAAAGQHAPSRSACPLCGTRERRFLLVKDGWRVVRCPSCRLVYLDACPDRDALEGFYGQSYYSGDVFADYLGEREARLAGARRKVGMLTRLEQSGRLLDVGCAAGFFLEAAAERYEVTGVELSEWAARHAREVLGHRVFTGELADAALPSAQFDIVTMWDVVEHLVDPPATLAEVARVTRPGGLLALSTGNVEGRLARRDLSRWDLMTPPWHLFFFSPETIERLLNAAGFEIARIYFDGRISTRPRLAQIKLQRLAALLAQGNIMILYARRVQRPRRRHWRARMPRPAQAIAHRRGRS